MSGSLTRSYRAGVLQDEGFPVAGVSEHLGRPDTIVWVDLCDPSEAEMRELAGELGLHELAVEDALGSHQRPKLDRYATHLFLSCHAVRLNRDLADLEDTEIDAFISERWLVTVRKDDRFPIDGVLSRWDRSPDLARYGVSFLLYGLLDVIVDGYFDTVEEFDDVLRRGERRDLRRGAARSLAAAALVRDAARARAVPSTGRSPRVRRSAG